MKRIEKLRQATKLAALRYTQTAVARDTGIAQNTISDFILRKTDDMLLSTAETLITYLRKKGLWGVDFNTKAKRKDRHRKGRRDTRRSRKRSKRADRH